MPQNRKKLQVHSDTLQGKHHTCLSHTNTCLPHTNTCLPREGGDPDSCFRRKNKRGEFGSVFVIILAGVALFGALMFTFSRSGSQGTNNLTKQQTKIAAQEILNYAHLVEGAVNRVRNNGCSENEISFENAVVSGYSNTNSPSDNSCHAFEDEGGKVEYILAQKKWLDSSFDIPLYINNYGYFLPHNNLPIEGIGTQESDLRFILNFVNKNICLAINDLIGVTNPSGNPPNDNNDSVANVAQGSFASPTANIIGDDGGHDLPGKTTFCREGGTVNQYQFSHVLLTR